MVEQLTLNQWVWGSSPQRCIAAARFCKCKCCGASLLFIFGGKSFISHKHGATKSSPITDGIFTIISKHIRNNGLLKWRRKIKNSVKIAKRFRNTRLKNRMSGGIKMRELGIAYLILNILTDNNRFTSENYTTYLYPQKFLQCKILSGYIKWTVISVLVYSADLVSSLKYVFCDFKNYFVWRSPWG